MKPLKGLNDSKTLIAAMTVKNLYKDLYIMALVVNRVY
jgi:hypothetical protein